MADPMRDSGLDLIREYIPDSPVYTPEDEPSQYDIPYVPASPVYPTPAYNPPTPEYIPSLITEVPELDLSDKKKEEDKHIKFLNPPASPQPSSMQCISPAADTMQPDSSGPPQGMPIPVHISRGIPPEILSDTDLDEELQHPDSTKEEGECTDQEMPPLEDASTEENETITFPPDPWNDSAFTLQDNLNQLRGEFLEKEPDSELYGYASYDEERKDMLIEMGRMHRCIDQIKRTLQSINESQENLTDFMIQKSTIKL